MASWYGLGADLVVLVHTGFVFFVLLGGVLVFRWPRLVWVHWPSVLWAVGIEWRGAVCPLTPLENWLLRQAGGAGYSGDFIQHYFLPVLYPIGLTREIQVILGVVALGVNVGVYTCLWRFRRSQNVG